MSEIGSTIWAARGAWCALRHRRVDALLCTVLALVAFAVLSKDISVGGFRFGDSAVHALDGVLIRDWVAAGPRVWLSPMEFAAEQYGHYPALGIGRHYPPGYALVEAAFFGLFGISIPVARFCVVCFGLLAVLGTYHLVRSYTDRLTGFLAAVVLVTMPATTTWGRQNMLEVPTLAATIWAAIALARYLRAPTRARLFCLVAMSVLAIMFRQTAVFFVVLAALVVVVAAFKGRVRFAHAVSMVIAAAIITIGAVLSLDSHGAQLLSGFATCPSRFGVESLAFYLKCLPAQASVPFLGAALLGAVLAWRKSAPASLFLLGWVGMCYAMLTIIDYKNPRFFFLALFPIAVLAGMAGSTLLSGIRSARVRIVLAVAVAAGCCARGISAPVKHRPDYGQVVEVHRSMFENGVVLFSGLRDGDFVFAVRQHVPWRRTIVVRASKLLYTCICRPELDFVSNVSDAEQLVSLLEPFAFKHIFIERENKLELSEDRMLRDYLSSGGDYQRVASYPLKADPIPSHRDVTIDIYKASRPKTRLADHLDIPIPQAGRTLRVDLRGWDG